jgi:beta-galactosidase GanA
LKSVAIDLIKEFGSVGYFITSQTIDPISGVVSGTDTTVSVTYYREYYSTKDLIENRILAGDAKLTFVSDNTPMQDWKFVDDVGDQWTIVIPPKPTEAQGLKIVYEAQIRK